MASESVPRPARGACDVCAVAAVRWRRGGVGVCSRACALAVGTKTGKDEEKKKKKKKKKNEALKATGGVTKASDRAQAPPGGREEAPPEEVPLEEDLLQGVQEEIPEGQRAIVPAWVDMTKVVLGVAQTEGARFICNYSRAPEDDAVRAYSWKHAVVAEDTRDDLGSLVVDAIDEPGVGAFRESVVLRSGKKKNLEAVRGALVVPTSMRVVGSAEKADKAIARLLSKQDPVELTPATSVSAAVEGLITGIPKTAPEDGGALPVIVLEVHVPTHRRADNTRINQMALGVVFHPPSLGWFGLNEKEADELAKFIRGELAELVAAVVGTWTPQTRRNPAPVVVAAARYDVPAGEDVYTAFVLGIQGAIVAYAYGHVADGGARTLADQIADRVRARQRDALARLGVPGERGTNRLKFRLDGMEELVEGWERGDAPGDMRDAIRDWLGEMDWEPGRLRPGLDLHRAIGEFLLEEIDVWAAELKEVDTAPVAKDLARASPDEARAAQTKRKEVLEELRALRARMSEGELGITAPAVGR